MCGTEKNAVFRHYWPKNPDLGASSRWFEQGNYCGTAGLSSGPEWEHYAALGLIGNSKPAIAGLEQCDSPQAQFYLGASLWIEGNDAEAVEILNACSLPEASRLKYLIEKPRIDVLAMSVWSEDDFSDPKFRVHNTGVLRPKLGDDGQFAPETCQIDEPQLSVKGLTPYPPDFFLGHMIEWQYLPYDLTELACPVFGTTSDLDLHIHNNQSWLPAFDEVITVGSEEWAKASSLRQGPSCTYPKLFGINPDEITAPGILERDVDLFVSGSVTNIYHPDKAQLTQTLLSDDSMYIRCIEGFLNKTSYFIELARSKTAFTYVRHPGSMPSRGIESLAAGCAVLTQPESALRLFFGEDEGVYSYQPDTLADDIRSLVKDWESTAPKALKGSERVLKEFTTERCTSQFLRYLTVKTAILGEKRPRQKVHSPHQKRVIAKRGWGYHTYVNFRMLNHTVGEAVRKENLNPTPHNAINMAREVDLFLSHDISCLENKKSEAVSESLKEAAADMFQRGFTKHPKSLILRFNQIRHFLHHGEPDQIPDTLNAIENLLNTSKTELQLDPSEDIMPWDYYDQFFNYRSYLDHTTEYLGGGNTDKDKLVDLIRASLAHYLGLYTGKIEWLEKATQWDSSFPHYSHSLAKALFSRNTEGDLARASEISRLLFLKSILITPCFGLLAKIHSINPELVRDWDNIENRYRKYRRTSYQSGPCPGLDTNCLVLPPETDPLPSANEMKGRPATETEEPKTLCHPAVPEKPKDNQSKILMISFECARWEDARAWSYNGFYAFRDAIEAHDIERITIPAIAGVPSSHKISFLSRIKELTQDFTFDQVWIWITHNEYDPVFLSYLEEIAPVRVGVITESLEHTKNEELHFANLADRREKVLGHLKHCTHALTFDEKDADSLPEDLPIKAMWCPPVVSWRDICKSIDLPKPKVAEFLGTPYNEERRAILNHPNLREILHHSQPPEQDSTLPLEFDNFQASNLEYLLDHKCDRVGYVVDFFQQIHRVRRHLNDIWQKGLRQSYMQVNLPSIFKSYAGRVVESMAAGRPVISWKPPGARSQALFTPGEEILWFDRDQPEQLAEQIQWLQTNPQEAERIAENARQKILKYHTAEARVQQVLNWIESGIAADYGETPLISKTETHPNKIMNNQTASLPRELDDVLKEADTCYEQGNSDGAINALEQALELTDRHPVILRALGTQLFSSERYTWARAIFEEFVTACPEDATGQVQYAITAFHDGDTDACAAALEQALVLEPNNMEALKLMADIDIREERWEEARTKYDKIAATGGITFEALHALAFCQFKTGDVGRSIDTYGQLLEFNADDELAQHNLEMLRSNLQELSTETAKVTPPQDENENEVTGSEDTLEQADFYMQAGNQQAALKELERAVLKNPKDGHLVEAFGSLLFSHGEMEQARKQFRRLIELTPRDAMAYTRLAMACYELERTEEFESALGLAMEIDPERPEILHFLGKVNMDAGRYYDAGRVFGKLLEIEPDNIQNLLALGNCLFNGKEEETAAAAFERALQLDPENSVARESLAVIRGETSNTVTIPVEEPSSESLPEILAQVEQALTEEDHTKAVQLLEHALRETPEEPCLLNALGNLHLRQSQNEQAAECFALRASLLPEEVDAQLQAAMTYFLSEDSEKFESFMEKALALDPTNPHGLKLLASANFKAEKYEEAANIYAQALSQLPEDVEMVLAMGVCFHRLQDLETAEACFKRALEIDPYNQIASENLQALAKPQPTSEEPEGGSADTQNPAETVGSLNKAHNLLKDGSHLEAWAQTVQAIEQRPFHPEAYLMLTEIALTSGDEAKAKTCLDELIKLTPNWRIARETLESLEKQQTLNTTNIDWPNIPAMNQNRVSVCMIVKDEEQYIGQCLESVKPIASQIVVMDTGSTDRTVDIAKEHGAEVYSFEWSNDFAAARNAALSHARGDWVLVIDADEVLPQSSHAAFNKDITSANAIGYRIPLMSVAKNEAGVEKPTGDGLCHVPRLFRNAPGIHFIGCVHEEAFSSVLTLQSEWEMESGFGHAQLIHYGYDPELKKERNKVKRNLNLMQKAIEERPANPSLLMNYALDLFNDGQIESALEKDREAFQTLATVPREEVLAEVRERLVSIFCFHLLQAELFEELLEVSTSQLAKDCGPTASIHYSQALALLNLRRHEEAIAPLQSCIGKRNEPVLTAPFKGVEEAGPHHLLADCLAKTDQYEEAQKEYDLALNEDPKNTSIRYGYAQFLTSIQEPEKAIHLLREAIDNSSIDCSLWSLGSQIVNAHIKDSEVALHWTACAIEECCTHPEAQKQRGVALLTVGRFEEALPFFEKAPQHAVTEAAKILCQTSVDKPMSPIDPDKEEIISTAFIHWYRRLLDYEGESAAQKIADKIGSLKKTLPTATRVLSEALAEPNEGTHPF